MVIKVPKDLEEDFKNFLDVAQFNVSNVESECTSKEKKVLKLVRKVIGRYSVHIKKKET